MAFESIRMSERLNGLFDLDPDLAFFSQATSKYYNEQAFNQLFFEQPALRNNFSLMFINIRSATKNLESMFDYLSTLNHNFSVIGLAETWLTPVTEHLCAVPGFNYYGQIQNDRTGGGVGFLVCNSLGYNARSDLGINTM